MLIVCYCADISSRYFVHIFLTQYDKVSYFTGNSKVSKD